MSPRKAKTQDTSNYKNLGTFHWKDFTPESGSYDPGKCNLKPQVEFLHPEGHNYTFHDHQKKTVITVHYDSEYVFDHYYKKIVVSMNWVNGDGEVRTETLKMFLDNFYNYCLQSGERIKQVKVETQVKAIIEATGKTENEVRAFLFGEQPKVLETKMSESVIDDSLKEQVIEQQTISTENEKSVPSETPDTPVSDNEVIPEKRGRGRPPKATTV